MVLRPPRTTGSPSMPGSRLALFAMPAMLLLLALQDPAAASAAATPAADGSVPLGATPWGAWPKKVISWWYASGTQESFEDLIKQIDQPARLPLVTSIQTYCGHDISDDGRIIMNPAQGNITACAEFFPELTKLGVRPELATGAGNCR
jgi:hypothetical protein